MVEWIGKKNKPLEPVISCELHLMVASPYPFHYKKKEKGNWNSVKAMICIDKGQLSHIHSLSCDSIKRCFLLIL